MPKNRKLPPAVANPGNGRLIFRLNQANNVWYPTIVGAVSGTIGLISYKVIPYDDITGFIIESCGDANRLLFYDKKISSLDTDLSIFCYVAEVSGYQIPDGKNGTRFPALIPDESMILDFATKQQIMHHWNVLNNPQPPTIIVPEAIWFAQQEEFRREQWLHNERQRQTEYNLYIAEQTARQLSHELFQRDRELMVLKDQVTQQHEDYIQKVINYNPDEIIAQEQEGQQQEQEKIIAANSLHSFSNKPRKITMEQLTSELIACFKKSEESEKSEDLHKLRDSIFALLNNDLIRHKT